MNKSSILFLSFLIASTVVYADMLLDADEAYYLKDFSTAFTLYEELAEQGDAAAQFNLAFMYDVGDGIPQDFKQAFKWYKKAAEQGVAEAQYNLSVMYLNGQYSDQRGIKYNYVQAFE